MSSYGWGIDVLWKNKHVIARPQDAPQGGLSCPYGAIHLLAIPWIEDRTDDTVWKIEEIATSPGGSSQ